MRPPQELLYDSEASLRLVDSAIEELSASEAEVNHEAQPANCRPLRHAMAASLREELSGLSNHLQFQDVTSQQLVHIAALLGDMRLRLSEVASMFGATPDGNAKSSAVQRQTA